MEIQPKNIKRKERVWYFGFGDSGDYPEWQTGLLTSLDKEELIEQYYHYDYKNPFVPRLRRLLKKYEENINYGLEHHTVWVKKGKGIRPLINEISRILINEGWILGDFNRSLAVDDMWDEHMGT